MTSNGMVKIGDFGISKILATTQAKADSFLGTPYYMSPEIFKDIPYSFGNDIWALGIILY